MSWTRTATGTGAVAILTMLLMAVTALPAVAASESHDRRNGAGQARFEGRTIDLKRGWGDAHACVVWTQDGDADCYRTEQAARAAVERHDRAEARTAAATWSMASSLDRRAMDDPGPWALFASQCGDWLTLYEHSGYTGRTLRFKDRGYYQDLADWGFANQTSSYRVGGCSATFRDAGWDLYPGWTGPYASASSMSSGWNDRVRYLRIN